MGATFKIGFDKTLGDVQRLVEQFDQIRESAQQFGQMTTDVERMIQSWAQPFEQVLLHDRAATYLTDTFANFQAGWDRHREAHVLVTAGLPKRGWYLSGKEPCTLSLRLAKAVKSENWDLVDQEVIKHLPKFKVEAVERGLKQEGVPDYCINRLRLFLSLHDAGEYEQATYLGVPLIDELSKLLYAGKAFTTKRGKGDQSKPELAIKTSNAPELGNYCSRFVQAFGSLQDDVDPQLLTDENYWNRSAIVHGMMKRAMNFKDSAKCLMAISFLFFAKKAEDEVSN